MQGFNRYYPPDFDPKVHDTLNKLHGKHALGDRARKLDQGILITRFELPFNIWCGGCNAHIGMGVRYNAEKKKVGNYYTTPIYAFRCKCHLCSHWFTIETDPKNTRYVVTEGARQQATEWDAEENGTVVLDEKDPTKPPDAFAAVEKSAKDKAAATTSKDRLVQLYEHSDSRWSDPFSLSQKLRATHRAQKSALLKESRSDDALRARYSLPDNLVLPAVSDFSTPGTSAEASRVLKAGTEEREAKRKREEAEVGYVAREGEGLKERLRLGSRKRADPFLNETSGSGVGGSGLALGLRKKRKLAPARVAGSEREAGSGEPQSSAGAEGVPVIVADYDSD